MATTGHTGSDMAIRVEEMKVTKTTEREVGKFLGGLKKFNDLIDFYMDPKNGTNVQKQRNGLVVFMTDGTLADMRSMKVCVAKSEQSAKSMEIWDDAKIWQEFIVAHNDAEKIMDYVTKRANRFKE